MSGVSASPSGRNGVPQLTNVKSFILFFTYNNTKIILDDGLTVKCRFPITVNYSPRYTKCRESFFEVTT